MKRIAKDRTGERYGRLLVIERAYKDANRVWFWNCVCDCGKKIVVAGANLANGHSASCGCLRNERALTASISHGLSRTPLYRAWSHMIGRCYDTNDNRFHCYGRRGISVCDKWRNDSASFLSWALNNGYKKGLSIERIDNDGNYEPDNCKWIPRKHQAKNRTTSNRVTIFGEKVCFVDACFSVGMNPSTIQTRISVGWSIACSMLLPLFKKDQMSLAKEVGRFAKRKRHLNSLKY